MIASKVRSIHFNIFSLYTPPMLHRAPFCATFLRKKVAKLMFNSMRKYMLWEKMITNPNNMTVRDSNPHYRSV